MSGDPTTESVTTAGFPARIARFEQRVFAIEKWLCCLALAVMVLAVLMTVFRRNLDLPWPNFGEWALVSVIPLTFIGAAMCTYLGSHIAVDAIRLMGVRGLETLSHFITAVANIFFSAVFVYSGWFVLTEAVASGERMLELGTPLAVPLAFIPLGMFLMMFHSLIDLLAVFIPSLEGKR